MKKVIFLSYCFLFLLDGIYSKSTLPQNQADRPLTEKTQLENEIEGITGKHLFNQATEEIELVKREIISIKEAVAEVASQTNRNEEKEASLQATHLVSEIKNKIEAIEKNIISYEEVEKISSQYIANQYNQVTNKAQQIPAKPEEITLEKINATYIVIGKLEEEIENIEKEIILTTKEENEYRASTKKSLVVTSFEEEAKNTKKDGEKKNNTDKKESQKNIFLEKSLEKVLTIYYTIKKKLLDSKKNFFKVFLQNVKEKITSYKNKFVKEKDIIEKESEQIKKYEKKWLEKKEEVRLIIEKNKKNKKDKESNESTLELIEKKIKAFEKKILEKRDDNLSSDFSLILKNIQENILEESNIIIDINIALLKKQNDIFEGWLAYFTPDVSAKKVNTILKQHTFTATQGIDNENKVELEKYLQKINFYKSFLTPYTAQSRSYPFLSKEKSQKVKDIITRINEKINEITTLKVAIKNVSFVIPFLKEDLKTKTFWARSEYSISQEKIQSAVPEIVNFFLYIKNNFIQETQSTYLNLIKSSKKNIFLSALFILFCLLFLLLPSLYKRFFSYFANLIDGIEKQSYYTRQIRTVVSFLARQSRFLYFWINTSLLFYYNIIAATYFKSLFYLSSSFFSVYIIHQLITLIHEEGIGIGDFLQDEKEESLIRQIKHFFIYRFIIYLFFGLFFLRLAILTLNPASPLGEIFLATNFILIQIQLIVFFKKKYILPYIREIKFLGDYPKEIFAEYYKLFILVLTMIIIMSNPYVGYGYQVIYILLRSILSIALLPLCNNLFEWLKKESIFLFFNFEEGEVTQKLRISKISYLLFVTLMYFVIFSAMTVTIVKLWGYSINLHVIKNLLYENILPNESESLRTGLPYVSLSTLFIVIFYIIKGFFYSYCINTFFIKKILNQIVVSQTMQLTISILIKYISVLIFFILGLFTAGIQNIIVQLGAIILAFSFALKEPLADFVSYFIIIIQRPIKIGDFIRLNKTTGGAEPDIIGIVRSIDSRTTVIRQRNMHTIIVPNSLILTRILYNWSYHQHGFTAIDDFVFTVSWHHDPETIKTILLQVIDSYQIILKNPKAIVRCSDINNSGFEFLIRAFISNERATEQWDIASYLRILIIKRLHEESISFGISEHNVHLKNNIASDEEYQDQESLLEK
jgi:potassium efflux system protein